MIRVLLIEDNAEMRENTAEILSLSNYEVMTAENGKLAMAYYEYWQNCHRRVIFRLCFLQQRQRRKIFEKE
jgi:CheY-like chemotaxis protein